MSALSWWFFPALLRPAGVLAFDALDEGEVDSLLKDKKKTKVDRGPLVCAACGERVTTLKERMEKNGAHAHTFTNPHGLTFEIGCFKHAPGCRPVGEATEAWTWFPGYAWRVGVCAACGAHLGWGYEPANPDPEDSGFFGLILDRLARPS